MSTVLSKHPVYPLSDVNAQYVNVDNSHSPGNFGSRATSLEFGLPALRNNVAAANGSQMTGGGSRKTLRRKIKNIIHKYKMPRKNRTTTKRKLRSLYKRKSAKRSRTVRRRKSHSRARAHTNRRSRSKSMRGGRYDQFGSNIPNTPSYSTGGILSANESALASPVPYQGLPCTTNCVDNYNFNTNKGFQV